ncbi:MAG TPA: hypothetical protein VNI02_00285, partial [Blastocatellia bacterium]|nr:hypothetical protein [Blastocatellia bacterium]
MRSRLKPLFKIFYNPLQAMIEIGSGAPYLAGAALALAATFIYREALSPELSATLRVISGGPSSPNLLLPGPALTRLIVRGILDSASPLFFLLVVFVPACVLAASLITRRASFSVLLRQEYAPLASCTLYGWAASHLMMLIPVAFAYRPGGPDPRLVEAALRLVPLPYFVFLATIALRAVLQVKYRSAVGVMALGACSLLALPLIPNLLYLLTSPFLLLLAILLLRNFFGTMMSAQRSREEFKQNLEAATL